MDKVLHVIFYLLDLLVTTIVLAASLRYALKGYLPIPKSRLVRVLTHVAWFACLVVILPMVIGQFARATASPLPWVEFSTIFQKYGLLDAFISTELVLITDLWLLWIPGHLWIQSHPGADRRMRNMARTINLLAGLLLATAANPFYQLIKMVYKF
jgi:hypothetical protein